MATVLLCSYTRDSAYQVVGVSINMEDPQCVVELNVGGVHYSTSLGTLRRDPDCYLGKLFSSVGRAKAPKDSANRYFIDRDGVLFRYILDFLRNSKLILPENFFEMSRLRQEAEYFQLPQMVKIIDTFPPTKPVFNLPFDPSDFSAMSISTVKQHLTPIPHKTPNNAAAASIPITSTTSTSPISNSNNSRDGPSISRSTSPSTEGKVFGMITLGYRGTFAFGRDGLADVKFRKLSRIIVCGKVSLCREVFKDTLNESRDPDRGENDRYTSRFFLKHSFLEQAFDMLQEEGFILVASCGSGTNSAGEVKPGLDTEEAKWQHYNEFIFERRPPQNVH